MLCLGADDATLDRETVTHPVARAVASIVLGNGNATVAGESVDALALVAWKTLRMAAGRQGVTGTAGV